jgi:hypothetical protein
MSDTDRREAVKKIAELKKQMENARSQIEELADRYQIEGITFGSQTYEPRRLEEDEDDEWNSSSEGEWMSSSERC